MIRVGDYLKGIDDLREATDRCEARVARLEAQRR